jgi:hypothetical protein
MRLRIFPRTCQAVAAAALEVMPGRQTPLVLNWMSPRVARVAVRASAAQVEVMPECQTFLAFNRMLPSAARTAELTW